MGYMARTRKKHMYKRYRYRYRYRGGAPKAKAKAKSMKKDFKDKKAALDKKADALQAKMEKKAGEMGKKALNMAKEGKKKLSAGLDKIQGKLSAKNQQRMQMARDKLKGAMAMMMPIIQRVGKTARPWIKAYMHMIKKMMTMYAAAVGAIASKAMGMGKMAYGKMSGMMGKSGSSGAMPGMGMMGKLPGMGAMMGNMSKMPGMGAMMGNMKKMPGMDAMMGNMNKMMGQVQNALPSAPPASQVDRSGKSFQKVVEEDTQGGKKPLLGGVDKTKGDAKKHFSTIFGYIKKRFKNKKNYLDPNFRVSWEGKKKNPPLTGPEYVDRAKEYLDPKSKVFNISGDTKMSKTFEKSVNDDILKGKFPLLEGIDINKKPAKGKSAKTLGYIKKRFINKANYVNENYKVSWEGKKKIHH